MNKGKNLSLSSGEINAYYSKMVTYNNVINYVIKFCSHIDLERFKRSLDILVEDIPVLKCRVQVGRFSIRWVPVEDYKLNLSIVNDSKEKDETIKKFLYEYNDPEVEPTFKMLLIRDSSKDTLYLKVNHIVSDAKGINEIIYSLSQIYSFGKTSAQVNYKMSEKEILKKFSFSKKIDALKNQESMRDIKSIIPGEINADNRFIEYIELDKNYLEAINLKRKEQKASMHEVLLTACYRSIFKLLKVENDEVYQIGVPINMRKFLEEDKQDTTGNLSYSVNTTLKCITNESFEDTLYRVMEVMRNIKKNNYALAEMIFYKILSMFGGLGVKKIYGIAQKSNMLVTCFSNIGEIDSKNIIFGETEVEDIYVIGPAIKGLMITISTYNKCLKMVVQSVDKEKLQPIVKEILKFVQDEINSYLNVNVYDMSFK